jgi:hypothetical protein
VINYAMINKEKVVANAQRALGYLLIAVSAEELN